MLASLVVAPTPALLRVIASPAPRPGHTWQRGALSSFVVYSIAMTLWWLVGFLGLEGAWPAPSRLVRRKAGCWAVQVGLGLLLA